MFSINLVCLTPTKVTHVCVCVCVCVRACVRACVHLYLSCSSALCFTELLKVLSVKFNDFYNKVVLYTTYPKLACVNGVLSIVLLPSKHVQYHLQSRLGM